MKRWKSEMLQNYLENSWLDGRDAANSVQIRGWTSEMLHHLGTHTIKGVRGGGAATRDTAAYSNIYIYMGK